MTIEEQLRAAVAEASADDRKYVIGPDLWPIAMTPVMRWRKVIDLAKEATDNP